MTNVNITFYIYHVSRTHHLMLLLDHWIFLVGYWLFILHRRIAMRRYLKIEYSVLNIEYLLFFSASLREIDYSCLTLIIILSEFIEY